ncbi:TDP-N-acetylfucosamine:lipid II N-acetylfucosaminyltransferase [Shewanella indica]|uniref:TDP-N-acetylfucosamine:lipid II N-acetylfucosaminyltransferase n=1 Tax=Shewanella indica TaxID=768528 RepID=UPI001F40B9DE|nr:TDP-N-acetylfucosamine:lipid II N-acetylfucosaminyltransferase [Shewanella indica]MCE9793850.1 TDP-N-acetylfucosamine:lipid II N-acetylfucosaminyltransferase [Shewanella indica]
MKSLIIPFLLRFSLKKSYWLVWGADLYSYNARNNKKSNYERLKDKIRFDVQKKVGHIVTYIEGDFELARKWYGNKSSRHLCLGYPSNTYKDYSIQTTGDSFNDKLTGISILVGNSADPSNLHSVAFKALEDYKDNNIIAPLSYGNAEYASFVTKCGYEKFGGSFYPLKKFLKKDDYVAILSKVDIAIFIHERQQAMGNIITLLGLGKKIYMNRKSTAYQCLKGLGLYVYDFEDFNIQRLNFNEMKHNVEFVECYFSVENLKKQWFDILSC